MKLETLIETVEVTDYKYTAQLRFPELKLTVDFEGTFDVEWDNKHPILVNLTAQVSGLPENEREDFELGLLEIVFKELIITAANVGDWWADHVGTLEDRGYEVHKDKLVDDALDEGGEP